MLSETKQQQLKALFAGLPFRLRRQLRLAILMQKKEDRSDLPWDALLALLEVTRSDEETHSDGEMDEATQRPLSAPLSAPLSEPQSAPRSEPRSKPRSGSLPETFLPETLRNTAGVITDRPAGPSRRQRHAAPSPQENWSNGPIQPAAHPRHTDIPDDEPGGEYDIREAHQAGRLNMASGHLPEGANEASAALSDEDCFPYGVAGDELSDEGQTHKAMIGSDQTNGSAGDAGSASAGEMGRDESVAAATPGSRIAGTKSSAEEKPVPEFRKTYNFPNIFAAHLWPAGMLAPSDLPDMADMLDLQAGDVRSGFFPARARPDPLEPLAPKPGMERQGAANHACAADHVKGVDATKVADTPDGIRQTPVIEPVFTLFKKLDTDTDLKPALPPTDRNGQAGPAEARGENRENASEAAAGRALTKKARRGLNQTGGAHTTPEPFSDKRAGIDREAPAQDIGKAQLRETKGDGPVSPRDAKPARPAAAMDAYPYRDNIENTSPDASLSQLDDSVPNDVGISAKDQISASANIPDTTTHNINSYIDEQSDTLSDEVFAPENIVATGMIDGRDNQQGSRAELATTRDLPEDSAPDHEDSEIATHPEDAQDMAAYLSHEKPDDKNHPVKDIHREKPVAEESAVQKSFVEKMANEKPAPQGTDPEIDRPGMATEQGDATPDMQAQPITSDKEAGIGNSGCESGPNDTDSKDNELKGNAPKNDEPTNNELTDNEPADNEPADNEPSDNEPENITLKGTGDKGTTPTHTGLKESDPGKKGPEDPRSEDTEAENSEEDTGADNTGPENLESRESPENLENRESPENRDTERGISAPNPLHMASAENLQKDDRRDINDTHGDDLSQTLPGADTAITGVKAPAQVTKKPRISKNTKKTGISAGSAGPAGSDDRLHKLGDVKSTGATAHEPRNAMHAFFSTLEGLIIDQPRYEGSIKGFIRANALPFIWRILNEDSAGVKIKTAWFDIEMAPEAQRADIISVARRNMHDAAFAALTAMTQRAEDEPLYKAELEDRLGEANAYQDMVELRQILPQIPVLVQFEAAAFDSPAGGMTTLTQLARMLDKMKDKSQEALQYAQYIILNRLLYPVDALLIWQKMQNARARPAAGIIIPDYLLAQLEREGVWLEAVTQEPPISVAMLGYAEQHIESVTRGLIHARKLKLRRIQNKFGVMDERGEKLFSRLIDIVMADLKSLLSGLNTGTKPDLMWVFSADGPEQLARYRAATEFCARAFAGRYGDMRATRLRKETAAIFSDIATAQTRLTAALYEKTEEQYSACLKLVDIFIPLIEVLFGADRLEAFRADIGEIAPQAVG